jgi:hypothetical protein
MLGGERRLPQLARCRTSRSQGVRLHSSYLSGFVWGKNIGWINLGAAPANLIAYADTTGANFGVNMDPATGGLSGLA